MADFAALATILDATDQCRGQTEPPLTRLQQDRSAIGACVALVKLRHHRLVAQIRKQDRLSCAIVDHAEAS
jgi:hypothetical protein